MMSSPLPTETNKPIIALLCVLTVALVVAAIFMANRPEPPPPLARGETYYTGHMVPKGQAKPWTGSPAKGAAAPSSASKPESPKGGVRTPAEPP